MGENSPRASKRSTFILQWVKKWVFLGNRFLPKIRRAVHLSMLCALLHACVMPLFNGIAPLHAKLHVFLTMFITNTEIRLHKMGCRQVESTYSAKGDTIEGRGHLPRAWLSTQG